MDKIKIFSPGTVANLSCGFDVLGCCLDNVGDYMNVSKNEDQEVRKTMRQLFEKEATIVSKVIKGKEEEGQKYKDYFDWSESIFISIFSYLMLLMIK